MSTNSALYVPHGICSPLISPIPHEADEIKSAESRVSRERLPRSLSDERFYTSNDDKVEWERSIDEESKEVNKETCKCLQINTNLLLYKVFYFLFYGAIGSLFPYLAVFYKQLYLSAKQVGFLIGVRPFIQMCAVPLWGALADTYDVKKYILLMSIASWLITNYSISIVRTPLEIACNINSTLFIPKEVNKLVKANKFPPDNLLTLKNTSLNYIYNKKNSTRKEILKEVGNMTYKSEREKRKTNNGFELVTIFRNLLEKMVVTRKIRNSLDDFNSTESQDSERHRIIAADELEGEFDSLNTDEEYPWPLDSIEKKPNKKEEDAVKRDSMKIFIVLIVITLIGTLLASPAATLADTATLENLGEETYLYGFQRLWGAFGWGLSAFVVGAVVSGVQNIFCAQGRHVDYILSFYVYASMMGLAFITAFFFKFKLLEERAPYTESLWEAIKLFSDVQHACFVITLLLSGAALGFIHTFLFWHLHDIGGTQLLFSVISAVQCTSEVLMYLVSGYIMLNIGCDNLFYIGIAANVIRLFAYSFTNQPLYSIPLEILQGVSSASIWTASVCYIGLIPGTPVTLQALLHGVYWGLGHGGGGILGGVLVSYIGSHSTFLVYGCICLSNLAILMLLKYWAKIINLLGSYTYVENIPSGTYILAHPRGVEEAKSFSDKET
ncbi:major facilitator superfamily domain-containing protein 6 [Hydra vulgaris]|uniref:Major facilitator superfamily domain-containing protein 6 n=1 Tax=Hydra vulgaris TaxID=6087 RepID=A0ABM4CX92_HYDVU